ncbi:Protein of unknown function [Mucilaginibacter lappiensis]|uniref:DUF3347 domain-containing protein n=1 Tax=Mucilaginibacter lappiensis TaxID=354630 RepID=A0ABR6PK72_9SPHI|nr:DUF3347 domain-containing protein [Mucilaginibacter lappiensis]MBB6110169.1 hypothetical protein [Mucilaginibacter lappiensis]SIR51106.1 Protein of unknown function [Mucilaginibacter lappiensis]
MKINLFNSTLLAGLVISVAACKQTSKPVQEKTTKPDSAKTIVAKVAYTSNTADVFNNYIGLKNQFLKSNMKGIKSTAAMLENKLAGIKGCTETATLAHQIATGDDIKAQRDAFLILSKDVIGLIKGAKFKSAHIYVDFCPMADNGKGGYWLSVNKAIENPYFPEHMKTCGQVKEQIN